MEKRKIYLDNSATTQTDEAVVKEMLPYFSDIYGNASSFHSFGREARTALDEARTKIASLLNASPEEIIFTGCGTESDNLAIFGILSAFGKKGHIITSKIEHHAVLHSCERLEKNGYEVTYVDTDKSGKVCAEDVIKAVKENTLLVTIMHANNEVGTIQPIEEIAAGLKIINKNRKDKIYFHTDAVQTAGKIKLDVEKLGADLLSIAAHKFHGPKGIGVLYVKKGTNISPIIFGGHHENGLRPGTENVAFAKAMAKALEIADADMQEHNKYVFRLREKLKKGILDTIPQVFINGSGENSVAGILNVSFTYIEGESLLLKLDMKGIAASTGSACASGSSDPSHVLTAMCVDPIAAQGAIRFSMSYKNTEEEIDYVLSVLPQLVDSLRAMSPVWQSKKND
ncbi:MAG: aminotransferase class V-fold PLP-dependent enzyme [Endomicrobium sp.]|jgi:cysteine desulfurase|nr:aminotransferase class V-fold PLP-dependent enzyme [Endomicrobium sp.]